MNYSDIFNLYFTEDGYIFSNILRKIQLPQDKTIELYEKYTVSSSMPWTSLSYMLYGDIRYYWILILANEGKDINPLYTKAGDVIYIVKPQYISSIVGELEESLNLN